MVSGGAGGSADPGSPTRAGALPARRPAPTTSSTTSTAAPAQGRAAFPSGATVTGAPAATGGGPSRSTRHTTRPGTRATSPRPDRVPTAAITGAAVPSGPSTTIHPTACAARAAASRSGAVASGERPSRSVARSSISGETAPRACSAAEAEPGPGWPRSSAHVTVATPSPSPPRTVSVRVPSREGDAASTVAGTGSPGSEGTVTTTPAPTQATTSATAAASAPRRTSARGRRPATPAAAATTSPSRGAVQTGSNPRTRPSGSAAVVPEATTADAASTTAATLATRAAGERSTPRPAAASPPARSAPRASSATPATGSTGIHAPSPTASATGAPVRCAGGSRRTANEVHAVADHAGKATPGAAVTARTASSRQRRAGPRRATTARPVAVPRPTRTGQVAGWSATVTTAASAPAATAVPSHGTGRRRAATSSAQSGTGARA